MGVGPVRTQAMKCNICPLHTMRHFTQRGIQGVATIKVIFRRRLCGVIRRSDDHILELNSEALEKITVW